MDLAVFWAIVAIASTTILIFWWKRRPKTAVRVSRQKMREFRVNRYDSGKESEEDISTQEKIADPVTSPEEVSTDGKSPQKPLLSSHPSAEENPVSTAHYSISQSSSDSASSDCYDRDTGLPISHPIRGLDSLLSWIPGFDSLCVSSVPLRRRIGHSDNDPSLLVCHDMKGGYTDDRFVQGTPSDANYHIYHWQCVSKFVYFSHHLVTIPPPGWINCAHTHGVPVLGTFITEWENGAKICAEMLRDESRYKKVADQLAAIAEYYKFDGWLINIENPIPKDDILKLQAFLVYLTGKMNASVSHSEVIWYDSVTTSGELKWQNELNSLNSPFYLACNGIFLNYSWHEGTLVRTASRGAGRLKTRIYVGIDVFARNTSYKGGFSSSEPLKKIFNHGLSAALFAPGWVFETRDVSQFSQHQDKFWSSLVSICQYCYGFGGLPLVTGFSRGIGSKFYINGKVAFHSAWMNLSAQDAQPTWLNNHYTLGSPHDISLQSVSLSTDDSYEGGHSLSIKGVIEGRRGKSKAVIRLFSCDLDVDKPLLVSYTFKSENSNEVDIGLILHIDRLPTYLALTGNHSTKDEDEDGKRLNEKLVDRYGIIRSSEVNADDFQMGLGAQHYEAYAPISQTYADVINEFTGESPNSGWTTRYFLIAKATLRQYKVKEVRIVLTPKEGQIGSPGSRPFAVKFGYIRIVSAAALKMCRAPASNVRCSDVHWTSSDRGLHLSLVLYWGYSPCPTQEEAAYYNVHTKDPLGEAEAFLGRAYTESFKVADFATSKEGRILFVVQVVTRSGFKLPLKKSASLLFGWTE